MRHPVVVSLSVTLCLHVATFAAAQETAKQKYSALFKKYSADSGGLRGAETDRERVEAVRTLDAFSSKFVDLAAEYPTDPVALTSLRQAVQIVGSTDSAAMQTFEWNKSDFPQGSSDDSAARTVELLLRHHVGSDQLGPVIDRLRYGYRLEYEACLKTLLERNPHREMQGLACLALGQYLHDKLRMLRLVENRPELVECYAIVFGDDFLPALKRLGENNLSARIEALFQRAADDYANVKFRNGTVGEVASSELYEIRHLGIGKPAPDIEGQDQDGKSFKLSDYRGKVVLLYFWSEY